MSRSARFSLLYLQLAWVLLVVLEIWVVAQGHVAVGLTTVVIAGGTGVLAVRLALARRSSVNREQTVDREIHEGRGPMTDYLLWTSLGLPIVIGVALAIVQA